jgi:tetratricopeptide (TPR) repeat protein
MRRTGIERREGLGRILAVLFILTLAIVIAACAGKSKKPAYKVIKKGPQEQTRTTEGGEVAPSEGAVGSEAAATPKRRASDRLVEKGQTHLQSEEYDLAASAFRDAVDVDSTNGAAYYFLALTYLHLGQPDLSAGFLDKADALLGSDEEWSLKIQDLRDQLGSATPELPAQPADQGGF